MDEVPSLTKVDRLETQKEKKLKIENNWMSIPSNFS